MIDEARALFQVAPKEFVAARNALVKQLKADGRKDDAAEVAALTRPRIAEYALNRAAVAEPAAVEAFASAVAAATEAQRDAIERGRGAALRSASERLREATGELVDGATRALDAAGESGAAQRMEITEILRSTLSERSLELLRQALVGSTTDADDDDVLAGEPPERTGRPATSQPKRAGRRRPTSASAEADDAGDVAAPSARASSTAERREHAQRAKERTVERRRIEHELRLAETRLAAARRDVDRATVARDESQASLDSAQERAESAGADVDALQEQRAALRQE